MEDIVHQLVLKQQQAHHVEQQQAIEELKNVIIDQQRKLEALEAGQVKQAQKIIKLKEALDEERSNQKAVNPRNRNNEVAFSAYITHDNYDYNANQLIKYDGVLYNSGQHDPITSSFECPFSGLYYISVEVFFRLGAGHASNDASIQVLKDDAAIGYTFLMDYDGDLDAASSVSLITECNVGEKIFVQTTRECTVGGKGDGSIGLSSFTGFWINQVI